MNAATLSQPLIMASGALLGSLARAGQWTLERYMRAPLASTGLLVMVTLTALAGSNALYFQTAEHPSPFFAPAREHIAALPTPALDRPAPSLPAIAAPQATAPLAAETTGSVTSAAIVPDAPVGNARMFAVQKKLFELNLFSGTIDGYYGPKTADAIRAFEQRNGMKLTGSTDDAVMEAILASDPSGRILRPASTPAPAPVQPQAALVPTPQPAPAATTLPQQNPAVARLPELSPAEQVFDDVAQTAANTIDSIIAAVDTSRTPPQAMANPPLPTVNVAATQAMPAPVAQAAATTGPAPQPLVTTAIARTPPANDTELVTQIQRGLASLGFFQSQVDGKPGPETARAIREFESFHRYKMTGQVQPDLVELLVKAGAII
ncbi:peptidoglycan-binding domain-containing protein [Devosia faecipullorum]|uniref:peptidoglycan-binding domain-containing protein n=1 Tax=Devosia faecipullorum TaxID=2755039 RepID=UPI00187B30DA|nr:peptidoglycan-binding protein [Devosia faecipullorum]MBE7733680.1 peptidoglycan-binding protein [Devosia faecipullorum]